MNSPHTEISKYVSWPVIFFVNALFGVLILVGYTRYYSKY